MAIKHLLVDFDGVICFWSKDNSDIEKKFGLPVNSIIDTAFSKELVLPAIRGEVTDGQWRQNIASRLYLKYPDSQASNAVTNWSLSPGEIDNDILALFLSYADVNLSLITNATSRLNSDLSAHGILGVFENIFNSSEIGIIKPEFKIFTHALDHIGVESDETVFIDDSKENVETAHRMGIKAHQFVEIETLKLFLEDTLKNCQRS